MMIALLLSAALCGSPSTSAAVEDRTPVVRTIGGMPPGDVELSDPRDAAHLVLGGGVALTIGSAAAFLAGLEAQRLLVATPHPREQADALMLTRSINGGISVASLVLGVAALGGGVAMLASAPPTADVPPAAPASRTTTNVTTTDAAMTVAPAEAP